MNIRLRIIDFVGHTQIAKWYKFIKNSQYWSLQEIENYQNEKLRLLVDHAFTNVPYYQKLFHSLGLHPSEIRSKVDLKKLPVITRKVLQNNYEELIAVNHREYKSQRRSTGGTTGEPVKYLSDLNSWSLHWAMKYHAWERSGYRIGDKVALIGGASVIPQKASLSRNVWNRINHLYPMPSSHMNDELLRSFANTIKKEKIRCIRGYPSSISVFSAFCMENGIKLSIDSVITTAEVLRSEYKRTIMDAFNPVIIDSYGCADGGGNANTCEHDAGFHISHESAIWEVCDLNGNEVLKGSLGEVTLTSLTNYAMPLLRYQPGDVIENTFDEDMCRCGRYLFRINGIVGKSTDILKFHNGHSLGGPGFPQLFREFPLQQWQLVQNTMDSLDVNIIPSELFTKDDENRIKELMQYHCGEGVFIRVNKLEEILLPKSGKQRIIINRTI